MKKLFIVLSLLVVGVCCFAQSNKHTCKVNLYYTGPSAKEAVQKADISDQVSLLKFTFQNVSAQMGLNIQEFNCVYYIDNKNDVYRRLMAIVVFETDFALMYTYDNNDNQSSSSIVDVDEIYYPEDKASFVVQY